MEAAEAPLRMEDAQTKDRAELEALWATIVVGPDASLATDNEWVSKGIEILLKARRETSTASLTGSQDTEEMVACAGQEEKESDRVDEGPPCVRPCDKLQMLRRDGKAKETFR